MGYAAGVLEKLPDSLRKDIITLTAEVEKLKRERYEQGLAFNLKKEEAGLARIRADKAEAILQAEKEVEAMISKAKSKGDIIVSAANEVAVGMKETAEKIIKDAVSTSEAADKFAESLDNREKKLDERERLINNAEKALTKKSELLYERAQAAVRALNDI